MRKNNQQLTISNQQLISMRHSSAHLLAMTILKLWPKTKLGIGPVIEDGFYYDFDFGKGVKISEKDFPKIEKEMKRQQKKNLSFVKKQISVSEAREIFQNQPYKLELIEEVKNQSTINNQQLTIYISNYISNSFIDLCKGPHVKNASQIGPFKLLSIAGAYWKGDEKNPMLTRIYGVCFPTKKELDHFLWQCQEAKKRDHRILGKKMDLFSFHKEAPGDVFWHPKGFSLMLSLYDYWRKKHQENGYIEVRTPELLTWETWDRSGHTSFFIDKMYKVQTPDSKVWNYAVKPMNCDGNIMIYKNKVRSYKEFPLRIGELGVVHRYEASGELHGIIRPREFTQDDAHIFCTPNQVKSEIKGVMDLCFEFYDTFGLKLDHLELSTKPEKSIGSDKIWEEAEKIMYQVLKEKKVLYQINEGEGAFYGPKIDFHLKDSMGRTWQCATIQLDFAQPENFDLEYISEKGTKERPVMIHRVIYGSVERFLGILIEHYAGAFPVWLSPVQAVIIPIADRHVRFAQAISEKLTRPRPSRDEVGKAQNLRVEIDDRNETMQKKIKEAEEQKIPYMIILGDKEAKSVKQWSNETMKQCKISVRQRGEKDLGQMSLEKFLAKIKKEIADFRNS